MQQGIKKIAFAFIAVLIWLPFIQQQTKLFSETELKGAYVKPTFPEFSVDSLYALKYQKHIEDYGNWHFGFRSALIRIKNSLNYVLFKELSVVDNMAGKDNYIFSIAHTERSLGLYYSGKEKNNSKVTRISFLKEMLQKKGVNLVVLLVPTKETIIPEFLPSRYRVDPKEQTDYKDLVSGFKKNNIPFIDYCSYFKQAHDTSRYPLYTKTGVHWSLYGASIAQDTLVSYMERTIGKPIPAYRRTGIELSDTARESDADFEGPLNLLFSLGQSQYVYPKLEMIDSTKKRFRPKTIVIGDSYFWQIKNREILTNIFSEDSRFWYYFATSFTFTDNSSKPVKEIDAIAELESADCVILLGSIGTIDRFPYGVADHYYDNRAVAGTHEGLCRYISSDQVWLEKLRKKAGNAETPIEDLVRAEAEAMLNDKKQWSLKAANGKYVCAGGPEESILRANRDNADGWEKFRFLKLSNEQIAICSYKNEFVSVSGNGDIVVSGIQLDPGKLFTLVTLDGGKVAIKASNGKYVSLDERSGHLVAISTKVGKNEMFMLSEHNN